MSEELKLCASCGGAARMMEGYAAQEVWLHGAFYRAYCTGCQFRQLFHRTEAEAIAAWNRRAQPAAPAATVDELIELSAALEKRRILEEIKKVAELRPADDMPTPFQAAWQQCCEEIFYRATGEQWHMDEDASKFTKNHAAATVKESLTPDAAPSVVEPEPEPEPVAWMWQHEETGRTGFVAGDFDQSHWEEHNPRLKIISPCFSHPPAAPSVVDGRTLFICTSCDGIYADEPVTQCDCMPDKQDFYLAYTSSHPPRAPLTDFEYDPSGEHPDADKVVDAWADASEAYAAAIPLYQHGLSEWIVRMRAAIRVLQEKLPKHEAAHGIAADRGAEG